MAGVVVTYHYLSPSRLGADGLALATSGPGVDPHPSFFSGFARRPDLVAAGLLAVARVARTRYYEPPSMTAARIRAADPVVTCDGERLRFESLSVCCGVHARLDVLADGLDATVAAAGTTNVDVNRPLRDALAKVGAGEPLHLGVGSDELRVTTLDGAVVEKKVPLPERWLRSFAEVQRASAAFAPVAVLPGAEARRVLLGLPSSRTRGRLWLVPAGRTLRLSARPAAGAVHLSGPERLGGLTALLRFASRVAVYGPAVSVASGDEPAGSAWVASLGSARLTITISPEISRGFSGEGGVLAALSDEVDDTDAVASALGTRATVGAVAASTGLRVERVRAALDVLSAAGAVGYDVTDGEHYARQLPFSSEVLEVMHPRLQAARQLVKAGAVSVAPGGERASVRSGDATYSLERQGDGGWRCTCLWFARHGTGRGLCKHALAVGLVLPKDTPLEETEQR